MLTSPCEEVLRDNLDGEFATASLKSIFHGVVNGAEAVEDTIRLATMLDP